MRLRRNLQKADTSKQDVNFINPANKRVIMKTENSKNIALSTEKQVARRAVISPCKKYRYALHREWDDNLPMVFFIMLNPSTADGEIDDPTIRRCVAFAKSWGFGSMSVGNLFGFRATDPRELLKAEDPMGPENAKWNEVAADVAEMVVCAWGNAPILKAMQKRYGKAYQPLSGLGQLHYIDLANDGTPKHPLYLRGDLQPKKYEVSVTKILI